MTSGSVTLLQINDTHGYLEPHPELIWRGGEASYPILGGYARIAGLFRKIRAARPGAVIALDNGDTLHGTFPAVRSKGEAFVPLLNALTLDGMTAHWEFAFGPTHLRALAARLSYPILASVDTPAKRRIALRKHAGRLARWILAGSRCSKFFGHREDMPMIARRAYGPIAAALLLAVPASAGAQNVPADIPSVTLKVADTFPPTGFVPEQEKAWAESITKKTGGKVKFQFFWSDSLFKQADGATNLAAGVADFARVASTYDPAKTQLWMTLDMPFNAKDYWCGISSSVQVAQEEPNLKKTFDQLGFLPVVGYSSGHFQFLSKGPIEKVSELAGKRIRSYGGARIKMYELLNISPIFMPYSQIYEGVERGVVDGAEATILLTESFKHYEVAKHMMITNSGFVAASPLSISMRRWNSFPESLKQIFREAAIEHDQEWARKMMELESIKLREFQEKRGLKVVNLSGADLAAIEKAGKEAQELWLADMDKKGVPARATWGKFQELNAACEKEVAANGYPWAKKK